MTRRYLVRLMSVLATAVLLSGLSYADSGEAFVPLDIPVKRLLSSPTLTASSVFDIPIGVKVTGRTADGKWYKAKISYDFLGHFEHEGWIQIEQ